MKDPNSVESAGIYLEGAVADRLQSKGVNLKAFQNKLFDPSGIEVTEIDVETNKAMIEITTGKRSKFDKACKLSTNYCGINPSHKDVIVYGTSSDYSPLGIADINNIPNSRYIKGDKTFANFDELISRVK